MGMLAVFQKERPKWVCHLAARAGVRPSIADPFVYIHSNIRGTTQLMELSHKFGVKNFVFASSSSVYGGSKNTFFLKMRLWIILLVHMLLLRRLVNYLRIHIIICIN